MNKIRAWQLLEDSCICKENFKNLRGKNGLANVEKHKHEAYENVIEALKLDPYDLRIYYIENQKVIQKTISALVASGIIKDTQFLLHF